MKKMGDLHELNKLKNITMDMLSHDLFLNNRDVQMFIINMLATGNNITLTEAHETMISSVRLHAVCLKIKAFGETLTKEILELQESIAAASKFATIQVLEDIDKLLSSHEDSVKAKLDEVSRMTSVSLCSNTLIYFTLDLTSLGVNLMMLNSFTYFNTARRRRLQIGFGVDRACTNTETRQKQFAKRCVFKHSRTHGCFSVHQVSYDQQGDTRRHQDEV